MSFLSQPIQDVIFPGVRKIGDISLSVVINESTNDTLTITKQPVQQGATISDHSYKEPVTLSMTAYFKDNSFNLANLFGSGNGLSKLYQELQDLQNSRETFTVVTPKRVYANMLMATLSQTTDKNTENCLAISMSFQEVIIVSVSTSTIPRIKQRIPAVTGATQNAGKKSALASLFEGIKGFFGGSK